MSQVSFKTWFGPLVVSAAIAYAIYRKHRILEVDWDTTTPYAGSYIIQGNKVTFKDSSYYQITSQDALPKRSTVTFKVLKQVEGSYIGFGIIKASQKQANYSGWTNPDSAGLWSNNSGKSGYIYVDGSHKVSYDQNLHLLQNDQLQMNVDLKGLSLTFTNKRNKATHTFPLEKHFQNEPVYIFVCLHLQGQSVSVIQQSISYLIFS